MHYYQMHNGHHTIVISWPVPDLCCQVLLYSPPKYFAELESEEEEVLIRRPLVASYDETSEEEAATNDEIFPEDAMRAGPLLPLRAGPVEVD